MKLLMRKYNSNYDFQLKKNVIIKFLSKKNKF